MLHATVSALLTWCLLHQAASLPPQAEEVFIGWKGETYQSRHAAAKQSAGDDKKRWTEVVSWEPRASVYHNFLTDEEAEHIKQRAAPMLKRSFTADDDGNLFLDDFRTSYGTFLKRKSDPVIEAIEDRIAVWTQLPAIYAEEMQVLRYGPGQQSKPHMDSFRDDAAGARVCTVLLYLNDVPEGGETAFPDSIHWVDDSLPNRFGPFSECAKGAVAVKPKKGDALMFWSIRPDGHTEDKFSMHTGCPVLKGVKWTATKWIHGKPFEPTDFGKKDLIDRIDPGLCQDVEKQCAEWAKAGECTKNPGFMVGDVDNAGHCPKSCGSCQPCAPGDKQCYNDNRRKAGFLVYSEDNLDDDAPEVQR